VLAVTSPRRSTLFPDAPTMGEAGVKGYELVAPIWVFGPKGMPAPVVARLSREIVAASSTPEFKALCETQGLDVDVRDAAWCKAHAPGELVRWKQLVDLTR
jgi:tripartite-type tricarboxylate transporter receptor subunit TctC